MPDHDPAMLAAVEKMEAQAVHDLRVHADISTILPPLPRSAAAAAAAEVSGSEHAALVSQRGSAGSMQGKSSVTQADEKEWHAWAFGTPMAPKERKEGWRERVGEVEKSAGRRPEGGANDGTGRKERAAADELNHSISHTLVADELNHSICLTNGKQGEEEAARSRAANRRLRPQTLVAYGLKH